MNAFVFLMLGAIILAPQMKIVQFAGAGQSQLQRQSPQQREAEEAEKKEDLSQAWLFTIKGQNWPTIRPFWQKTDFTNAKGGMGRIQKAVSVPMQIDTNGQRKPIIIPPSKLKKGFYTKANSETVYNYYLGMAMSAYILAQDLRAPNILYNKVKHHILFNSGTNKISLLEDLGNDFPRNELDISTWVHPSVQNPQTDNVLLCGQSNVEIPAINAKVTFKVGLAGHLFITGLPFTLASGTEYEKVLVGLKCNPMQASPATSRICYFYSFMIGYLP